MQTPVCQQWLDEGTKLAGDSTEERKNEIARQFLSACHSVGLEVIAITDHNFAPSVGRSLLPNLLTENLRVAIEANRPPLIILPGFEVTADVGKGYHVVCIFPPETPLEVIDARVTALGLPPETRFKANGQPIPSTKQLDDILTVVQRQRPHSGLVIAAHSMSNGGIFDSTRISDWLQQNDFKNPDLLCVEIPKPVEEMNPSFQKLLRGGPDCIEEYRRTRPIAYVMSSDCYQLSEDTARPGNYIGYRHTWIRMSEPTIESLRQAFLDRDSRIRFGPSCPDLGYTHPIIKQVRVSGTTFLRRLEEIEWSPNLNCLIGSRGTGKSSLIDYIRLALDQAQDDDLPANLRSEFRERAIQTLGTGARIQVDFRTAGGEYRTICLGNGEPSRRTFKLSEHGAEEEIEVDIRTLFPCRILSQREIDYIVGSPDPSNLRRVLDEFIGPQLRQLENKAQDVASKIEELDSSIKGLREKQTRRLHAQTRKQELENQLTAAQAMTDVLTAWGDSEQARIVIERIQARSRGIAGEIRAFIESVTPEFTELSESVKAGPHAELLQRASDMVSEAIYQLKKDLQEATESFEGKILTSDSVLNILIDNSWRPKRLTMESKLEGAKEQLNQAGVDMAEVQDLPQEISDYAEQIAALQSDLKHLDSLELRREELLKELREVWMNQTQGRLKIAENLMNKTKLGISSRPLVEIQIIYQGDTHQLLNSLSRYISDGRSLSINDIRDVLDYLEDNSQDDRPLIEQFIQEVRSNLPNIRSYNMLSTSRIDTIYNTYNETVLRDLELVRINDVVHYRVFRNDGTLAGMIERVSAGQKGTAILNLLLASGTEPLIVDTPEEGLDSEGVFAEIVPLFRRTKENRQIIIATHSANIPVNGDAEYIVALEATGYVLEGTAKSLGEAEGITLTEEEWDHVDSLIRWPDWQEQVVQYLVNSKHQYEESALKFCTSIGEMRATESRIRARQRSSGSLELASGALDRTQVKKAVQDIMEGSEKAFRQRWDMYGF